jgi:hypothetical protein
MEIEILYLAGCPHVRPTLDRLHRILETNGLACPILRTRVMSVEAAQSVRFLGSPTVRINGIDIEPSARSRTDFGIMCRTYEGSGGIPSEALIRSAIAEADAGQKPHPTSAAVLKFV